MPEETHGSLTEQEKFLSDLEPGNQTPLDQMLEPEAVAPAPETEPEEEDKGNRRYRRLQEKYQAERESSIQLAERLKAIEEAQRAKTDDASDYLKKVERIYGTDSPEAVAATELLKSALTDLENRAVEKAYARLEESQKQEREIISQADKALDEMIEDIEDEYNTMLDDSTKKGFFQLLEKLSPKNREGEITAYADHRAVWEELQARKAKAENPAKALAARSMVRSAASPQITVEQGANDRWLREQGLL